MSFLTFLSKQKERASKDIKESWKAMRTTNVIKRLPNNVMLTKKFTENANKTHKRRIKVNEEVFTVIIRLKNGDAQEFKIAFFVGFLCYSYQAFVGLGYIFKTQLKVLLMNKISKIWLN